MAVGIYFLLLLYGGGVGGGEGTESLNDTSPNIWQHEGAYKIRNLTQTGAYQTSSTPGAHLESSR